MSKTRQLAFDAMLAAMCAVLGALSIDLGNLKITFEGFPVILGALLFGPLDGMAIGGIGTLVYQLLRYGVSVTTPLWILPYLLAGLLVGVLAKGGPALSLKRLAAAVFASNLMIFLLNTLVLFLDSKIYGYYSAVYIFGSFFPRLLLCLGKAAAYTAVLPELLRVSRRVLKDGRV